MPLNSITWITVQWLTNTLLNLLEAQWPYWTYFEKGWKLVQDGSKDWRQDSHCPRMSRQSGPFELESPESSNRCIFAQPFDCDAAPTGASPAPSATIFLLWKTSLAAIFCSPPLPPRWPQRLRPRSLPRHACSGFLSAPRRRMAFWPTTGTPGAAN